MLKLKEVKARTILTKSGIPGVDYVINPYTGCMHSCVYCYARFMKRFTNHKESWGRFLDVKTNAAELVPCKSEKYKGKKVMLSSVTDAYQPAERKYMLTRKILEKLIPLQPRLSVLTKSDLVVRDIDLFKRFDECEVGMSVGCSDEGLRKELEPLASPVEKRFEALRELREAGISTYLFMAPIIPFLTDWKKIVEETREYVDCFWFDSLNLKKTNSRPLESWLTANHPELLREYQKILMGRSGYWRKLAREIREYGKREGLDFIVYFART